MWLKDGTPVINSVCVGPANDTSNGHYLYYFRDTLNKTDPGKDLAGRIAWAANTCAHTKPFAKLCQHLARGLRAKVVARATVCATWAPSSQSRPATTAVTLFVQLPVCWCMWLWGGWLKRGQHGAERWSRPLGIGAPPPVSSAGTMPLLGYARECVCA